MTAAETFRALLTTNRLADDDATLARYAAFLDQLLLTNEVTNLTAVRDEGQAWTRHLADSLATAIRIGWRGDWPRRATSLGAAEGASADGSRGDRARAVDQGARADSPRLSRAMRCDAGTDHSASPAHHASARRFGSSSRLWTPAISFGS